MNEHLQAARDMLTFHGIDPRDIPRDKIYADGYDRLKRDRGVRVMSSEGLVTEFVPWPKSFPVASFFKHYWAWKRAVV